MGFHICSRYLGRCYRRCHHNVMQLSTWKRIINSRKSFLVSIWPALHIMHSKNLIKITNNISPIEITIFLSMDLGVLKLVQEEDVRDILWLGLKVLQVVPTIEIIFMVLISPLIHMLLHWNGAIHVDNDQLKGQEITMLGFNLLVQLKIETGVRVDHGWLVIAMMHHKLNQEMVKMEIPLFTIMLLLVEVFYSMRTLIF